MCWEDKSERTACWQMAHLYAFLRGADCFQKNGDRFKAWRCWWKEERRIIAYKRTQGEDVRRQGNRKCGRDKEKKRGGSTAESKERAQRRDRGGTPLWLLRYFTLISRVVPLKPFISSSMFHWSSWQNTCTHIRTSRYVQTFSRHIYVYLQIVLIIK